MRPIVLWIVLVGFLGWSSDLGAETIPVSFQDDGDRIDDVFDTGDGGDGAFVGDRNINTDETPVLEFTSFLIPSGVEVKVSGSVPLEIRVTGLVTIDGVLNVSGLDGAISDAGTTSERPPGGLGGAGGGRGGSGALVGSDPGEDGQGDGGGKGGFVEGSCGPGNGGGGGGHGSAGETAPEFAVGQGPGGAGGSVYDDPKNWSTEFLGGSGGGGGGAESDGCNFPADDPGTGGGGGGGAIRISAGGKIVIQGMIKANGGKSGNCIQTTSNESDCGIGGGGSGGSIFLQSADQIEINGELQAVGGNAGVGVNVDQPRPGGKGGVGIIRFDDADALTSGAGSVSPAPAFLGLVLSDRDPDEDGYFGSDDNCPEIPNEDQSDQDLDGVGDVCDCAPQDPNEPGEDGDCPVCGIGNGARIAPSAPNGYPILLLFLLNGIFARIFRRW